MGGPDLPCSSAEPAWAHAPEIEVLTVIASGAATRQVARQLSITPKTAQSYIERIYTKIGASTRSTATLFAMQHGVLNTPRASRFVGQPRTTSPIPARSVPP